MCQLDRPITSTPHFCRLVCDDTKAVDDTASEDVVHLVGQIGFARAITKCSVLRADFEQIVTQEVFISLCSSALATLHFGEIFEKRRSAKEDPWMQLGIAIQQP